MGNVFTSGRGKEITVTETSILKAHQIYEETKKSNNDTFKECINDINPSNEENSKIKKQVDNETITSEKENESTEMDIEFTAENFTFNECIINMNASNKEKREIEVEFENMTSKIENEPTNMEVECTSENFTFNECINKINNNFHLNRNNEANDELRMQTKNKDITYEKDDESTKMEYEPT